MKVKLDVHGVDVKVWTFMVLMLKCYFLGKASAELCSFEKRNFCIILNCQEDDSIGNITLLLCDCKILLIGW